MDPPWMKMTHRAIQRRRRRREIKALMKSLKDISGIRTERQLGEEFNYLQRQNRAWLRYQVQLPSRGDIPVHAERELEILFGRNTRAYKETNLPVLEGGKTLSPKAAAAWARLREEREAVKEEMETEITPDWFDRVALAEKRTRGERRAAQRERAKLEGDMNKLCDLGLGGDAENRDRMEEGGEIKSRRNDNQDTGMVVDATGVGEHEAM